MPTVRGGGGQVSRGGYHNSGDIKKTQKPEYARDDLDKAFAGDENEASQVGADEGGHSTHVRNRKRKESEPENFEK